jgi:hypothetical protein
LTSDELERLERPYTPRTDFQGVSDEAELQRITARIPGYAQVRVGTGAGDVGGRGP